MRLIYVCLLGSLIGCGAKSIGPPPLTAAQRQSIKQNLVQLKARVTADEPDGLYLSLRNTHVEVREFGGAVDGTLRTGKDVQDFGLVSEALAKAFLDAPDV